LNHFSRFSLAQVFSCHEPFEAN